MKKKNKKVQAQPKAAKAAENKSAGKVKDKKAVKQKRPPYLFVALSVLASALSIVVPLEFFNRGSNMLLMLTVNLGAYIYCGMCYVFYDKNDGNAFDNVRKYLVFPHILFNAASENILVSLFFNNSITDFSDIPIWGFLAAVIFVVSFFHICKHMYEVSFSRDMKNGLETLVRKNKIVYGVVRLLQKKYSINEVYKEIKENIYSIGIVISDILAAGSIKIGCAIFGAIFYTFLFYTYLQLIDLFTLWLPLGLLIAFFSIALLLSKLSPPEEPLRSFAPSDDENAIHSKAKEYFSFLRGAVKDRRMTNIAVTGDYGIGKSSIVKAFEKKEKKRYVYLSVSELIESEKSEDNILTQGDIEKNLLRYLLSVCRDKMIPFSRFEKVPEELNFGKKFLLPFKLTLFICSGVMTFLDDSLKTWIKGVNFLPKSLEKISGFWNGHALTDWMFTVANWVFVIITPFILMYVIKTIIHHYKMPKFNAKISNGKNEASAELDRRIEPIDFDTNFMEIVYILRQIGDHHDNIFVIEDFDRFDAELCVPILTKLRQFNLILNDRRKGLRKKKYTFIYILKESIFNEYKESQKNRKFDRDVYKFFDVIIPVVPEINSSNSRAYLENTLNGIGPFESRFIESVAPFLTDYRRISDICNEYRVFAVNFADDLRTDFKRTQLLAFVVFKVYFPETYYKMRTNEKTEPIDDPLFEALNKEKYFDYDFDTKTGSSLLFIGNDSSHHLNKKFRKLCDEVNVYVSRMENEDIKKRWNNSYLPMKNVDIDDPNMGTVDPTDGLFKPFAVYRNGRLAYSWEIISEHDNKELLKIAFACYEAFPTQGNAEQCSWVMSYMSAPSLDDIHSLFELTKKYRSEVLVSNFLTSAANVIGVKKSGSYSEMLSVNSEIYEMASRVYDESDKGNECVLRYSRFIEETERCLPKSSRGAMVEKIKELIDIFDGFEEQHEELCQRYIRCRLIVERQMFSSLEKMPIMSDINDEGLAKYFGFDEGMSEDEKKKYIGKIYDECFGKKTDVKSPPKNSTKE